MSGDNTQAGPPTACPEAVVGGQLYVRETDGHWHEVDQQTLFAAAETTPPGIASAAR